jgi:hypothetical protein
MRAAVASMFDANTSPSKVQNTLRVKYANDIVKLMEIPSLPALRNHLRSLRRSNTVISRRVDDDESPFIHDSIQKLFTPWCMYAYSQPP